MSHPGGSLGRKLLLEVGDVMQSGDRLPKVAPDTKLSAALLEMSHKGMGLTAIVDADDRVLGVFTDGDLRRVLDQGIDVREVRVDAVMTRGGKTARADQLAADRKSTRLNSVTNAHIVCRLLLEKNKKKTQH